MFFCVQTMNSHGSSKLQERSGVGRRVVERLLGSRRRGFLRLRMMVLVVMVVVMMTLKMILGSSWVSEKEEDNKALSVVEYSYNRQKKALVKTLKRHERHVPSCWCGVRTSLIQSTPHSRLVSPAGETIRALRKSDMNTGGG